MTVQAFQIDDLAILTVRDGDELVCSGLYPVIREGPGMFLVDFGAELGTVPVAVMSICSDVAVVGPAARPGQQRFTWSGEMAD